MNDAKTNAKEVFLSALDCASPEDLTQYLEEACSGDAALRDRVEELLRAQREAGSFLGGRWTSATQALAIAESPGTVIGPYKLLQQVGEGGMGVVFMAEQKLPVDRKVALKIIKPGMDTRQVIARFEAERQALALMDHPNIARVLDAGTTESGRPYFVMELVRGVPITEYCDAHQLSPRERIELFLPVCQAVQHAHQKGIIHRDLKPSNILIAEFDHEPVAKIIDFGVAKATAQRLTERTLFTEFGQVMGTVEYMSPEQAKLNQLDVDTRSDIYSLGVLLYEVLTGETPHDRQKLRAAAFDEVLRIIREDEPPRPSTRLSSSNALPKIASNRRLEPAKLARLIRGELDWIVMKCLEKDRNRRYETAIGLAADLQHYLQDEPVQACPPSAYYRLKKFVRRNSALATYLAGLTFSMILSMVFIISLVRQREAKEGALDLAKMNEKRATAEVVKATAISDVLQQMLRTANPDAARGADYTVRQMLDDFSAKFSDELDDQPEVKATIHSIIGNAYQRLGELDKAAPHLESALEQRTKLFGHNHLEVAHSLTDHARFKSEQGQTREAISLAQEALSIHDRLNTSDEQRIKVLDELALHLWAVGKWEELQPIIKEIRNIAAKNPNKYPEAANLLHRLAETMVDPVIGEEYAREALTLHRHLHGKTHPETAWGLRALAMTLGRQNKVEEAERYYREALEVFRLSYGADAAPVVLTLRDLAALLQSSGDEAKIDELRTKADQIFLLQESPDWERWLYGGGLHAELDQWDKAEASFSRARQLNPTRIATIRNLAWVRLADQNEAGYREACLELVEAAEVGDYSLSDAAFLSSMLPNKVVEPNRLVALASRAAAAHPKDTNCLNAYGAALYRAGRLEDAQPHLAEAVELAKGNTTSASFFLAMTEYRLGRSTEAWARVDEMGKSIGALKPAGEPHVGLEWVDRLILKMLLREAEQILSVNADEEKTL